METGFRLALPTRGRREGGASVCPSPKEGPGNSLCFSLLVRQNIFPREQTALPAASCQSRCLGVLGDGWTVCPEPCVSGSKTVWPAPRTGTASECEALGGGSRRVVVPPGTSCKWVWDLRSQNHRLQSPHQVSSGTTAPVPGARRWWAAQAAGH